MRNDEITQYEYGEEEMPRRLTWLVEDEDGR